MRGQRWGKEEKKKKDFKASCLPCLVLLPESSVEFKRGKNGKHRKKERKESFKKDGKKERKKKGRKKENEGRRK